MLKCQNKIATAVGEAMVELATVGEGLYRRGFAGDTFNTAWHMSQILGATAKVGFTTTVGQDNLSNAFVTQAVDDGLDVSGIGRDADRSMGLYMIELDGFERSFSYWRKDSAAVALADDKDALAKALNGTGLIHLSGITLAILAPKARTNLFEALSVAREHGSHVSFDPNIRPRLWSSRTEIRETISQALTVTDIALPSFDDEQTHWGDTSPEATIKRFSDAGVREIIVKNGEAPTSLFVDGAIQELETPVVQDIQDTTGAGDAFNAGYLAARLLGQAPSAAILHAQRLSGEVICHFGARIPKSLIQPLEA